MRQEGSEQESSEQEREEDQQSEEAKDMEMERIREGKRAVGQTSERPWRAHRLGIREALPQSHPVPFLVPPLRGGPGEAQRPQENDAND